jgi:hypothetical protein
LLGKGHKCSRGTGPRVVPHGELVKNYRALEKAMLENVDKSAVEKDAGCTSPIKMDCFQSKGVGRKAFCKLLNRKRMGDGRFRYFGLGGLIKQGVKEAGRQRQETTRPERGRNPGRQSGTSRLAADYQGRC